MTVGTLAERIPKIHLHCHLEGSLRASTFVELAAKHGVPLRYHPSWVAASAFDSAQDDTGSTAQDDTGKTAQDDTGSTAQDDTGSTAQDDTGSVVDPAEPYRFRNLHEFLMLFAAVSRSLQDPEDYARLAREFVEDALTQSVIYGELFVSPPVWTFFNPGLDVRTTMEAIVGELRRSQPRATFKLLPDLTRNFGARSAMQTARAMALMTDLDVIGVSLGGDEARFPAKMFVDAFAFARAQGLHCVAHAGEAGGPHSVRDAIELLHAERIGHGIYALEDQNTLELLATSRIPLEICPTSNRLTGAALPEHPHPYQDFDELGCIVAIDSDDPAIFRTSIQREYAMVEQVAGGAALERYVRNAVHASFAGSEAKQAMEAQLATALAELQMRPRS